MADRVMLITWGENFAGREERGLEVFNEALGMYGKMQQDGRIEGFEVVLLSPNGGQIGGYISVRGTADQLAAVREDDAYLRNMVDASLVVQHLNVSVGYCNEGVARMVEVYQEALSKVPQMA